MPTPEMTPECAEWDLANPDHVRCSGLIPNAQWWEEGTPCGCPCHSIERCLAVYQIDHKPEVVYWCDLHQGHGGTQHRDRFVFWSIEP